MTNTECARAATMNTTMREVAAEHQRQAGERVAHAERESQPLQRPAPRTKKSTQDCQDDELVDNQTSKIPIVDGTHRVREHSNRRDQDEEVRGQKNPERTHDHEQELGPSRQSTN